MLKNYKTLVLALLCSISHTTMTLADDNMSEMSVTASIVHDHDAQLSAQDMSADQVTMMDDSPAAMSADDQASDSTADDSAAASDKSDDMPAAQSESLVDNIEPDAVQMSADTADVMSSSSAKMISPSQNDDDNRNLLSDAESLLQNEYDEDDDNATDMLSVQMMEKMQDHDAMMAE